MDIEEFVGEEMIRSMRKVLRKFGFRVERRIKEVESWDGSASNYPDAEAYARASLLNFNPAAGKTSVEDWSKDLVSLPVRENGDAEDVYVKQAIYAAAGGRGIGAVTKPEDVSQEDFDRMIREAANKIISAYGQMDEDAPDAIYELAGKEKPSGEEEEERATSIPDVYSQISAPLYEAMMNGEEAPWLVDIYLDEKDGGRMFALLALNGKLYKADVISNENGYSYGEMVEVVHDFQPSVSSERSRLMVQRQGDGRMRWFAVPACTSVLNRCGEIDSRELFDSFVEHAEATGEYPVLDIYHLENATRVGIADYVARDDNVYMITGLFDDTPLAHAVMNGLENGDNWGVSIAYMPIDGDYEEVAEGIKIPVYKRGVNKFVSILLEQDAASLFTALAIKPETEVRGMNKHVKDVLKKLVGEGELLEDIEMKVDGVNREVIDSNLITRSDEVVEPVEVQEAVEEEDEVEFELDEELLAELSKQMLESDAFKGAVATIVGEQLVGVDVKLNGIHDALENLQSLLGEKVEEVNTRLKSLEKTEDEKRAEWQADLPAKKVIGVSYRPRMAKSDNQPDASYQELASATLANLK